MWSVLVLLVTLSGAQSAKILGVFPMTAPSHYILGSSLMKALAEKGHDVTVISPFGEKEPPKNGSYRDIVLRGFAEEHDKKIKELAAFSQRKIHPLLMAPLIPKMMIDMTEKTLNSSGVQELIHSGETFDVVIIEEFANHALKGLAPHFGAHLVVLSTMGANRWINNLVGNTGPLSYVSDMMLGYSSKMSFGERLVNTLMYTVGELTNYFYVNGKHDALVKKHFQGAPDLEDIMYNVSLVLINSHPSTNQPVPYVPAMVDIGGFHVRPPKKLPNDLQQLLDNAKDGIIYFSMGSNIKSAFLPVETRQHFLNAFSKLKEKVLWKWEDDDLPGKPPNVHVAKWLPQQDILAHPNVKLFITHGGLLSTIETIYHGVPVLAIPIGGDQNLNAKQIINHGFGLAISFSEVTEELLTEKLDILLNDQRFRENAKTRSRLYHDRLVNPLDTAIYWIEYLVRHGGAPHLRVASLDLPLYQYFLLDVIATVAVSVFVILYISVKVVRKLCSSRKTKPKIKKH